MPANCECPEGYVYEEQTDECVERLSVPAICTGPSYPVVAGDDVYIYGTNGVNFYGDVTSAELPLGENAFALVLNDANLNDLTVLQNVQNTLWGQPSGSLGRLIEAGIWADTFNGQPYNEWIGFSVCLSVPATKTYSLGFGSDNSIRIAIDGNKLVEVGVGGIHSYTFWSVIDVQLDAGDHIITIEGLNTSGAAAIAAEIYNSNYNELSTMTTIAELNDVIEWSTKDLIGVENFDSGEISGCNCPEGYTLNSCGEGLDCVQINRVEPLTCGDCYIATNCDNPEEVINIRGNFDTNNIHVFEEYSDKCWIVSLSTCVEEYTIPTVSSVYNDCFECAPEGPVYRLSDCNGVAADIIVSNDLSQYVGMVVKVKGSNCCWTVESFIGKSLIQEFVQFSFYTCDECLEIPIYKLVKPQRYVAPGYKYAACSTDYIDKVKCSFVDVMFKKMKSALFSIDLCTKNEDKILLQNEALDLKLIQDKTEDLKINENCCKTFEFILNLNVSQEGSVSGVDCNGDDVFITLEECKPSVELCLDIEFDIETVGEIEIIKKNECRL